jgi:hypothetical protein
LAGCSSSQVKSVARAAVVTHAAEKISQDNANSTLEDSLSKKYITAEVTKYVGVTPSEMAQPDNDNKFIAILVTIKNNSSSENYEYNPLNFQVKDSSGNMALPSAKLFDLQNSLQVGTLAPGGTVTGYIGYEVPSSSPEFVVEFNRDYDNNFIEISTLKNN